MSTAAPPPVTPAVTPIVKPLTDGPLQVAGSVGCKSAAGQDLSHAETFYLCRCGGSANKPFCDGTHKKIGFTSKVDQAAIKGEERHDYRGAYITIHDDRSVCSHVGYCTEHSPSVFLLGQTPWISPDGDDAQRTAQTVALCPSGALRYTLNGILQRDPVRAPCVHVLRDGPYFVVGGPALAHETAPAAPEHYTLCRCGASKNKPFCDGSHWSVGFKDG